MPPKKVLIQPVANWETFQVRTLLFKVTATDLKYFARSKFSRRLVHNIFFMLDMKSSFQVSFVKI